MGKGVNYSGAFMRRDTPLEQLPEKPLKLGANFFRKLVRRIETIVPTQAESEGGQDPLILVNPNTGNQPGLVISASTIELDVCINGEPGKIQVVGRVSRET